MTTLNDMHTVGLNSQHDQIQCDIIQAVSHAHSGSTPTDACVQCEVIHAMGPDIHGMMAISV